MDLNRLTERALAFQRIPAPTFSEAARAERLAHELTDAGVADVFTDDVGNVLARLPGRGPQAVVVSAHLDSVFGPEDHRPALRIQDRLIGPGIGDNAVSLAALVELALDAAQRSLDAAVWLVGTVCEEGLGNLRGMRRVTQRFAQVASAFIVLEGMPLGTIYNRALPIRRYRVTVSAPGGHAWTHAGQPSALHALIRLGSALLEASLPSNARTSLNIGRMGGGTGINVLAPRAWLEIDLRSESAEALAEAAAAVEGIVGRHIRAGEVKLELSSIGDRPGGELPAGHPLVLAARRALEEIGLSPVLEIGSTDASVPLSQGLPAVCIGITRGGGAHTVEEYIELGPLQDGFQALLRLVLDATRLGAGLTRESGQSASSPA